jgi:DNA-directed RNA polymerase subunit alpha
MPDYNVILPSKPKVISEKGNSGVYEVDSLYPGYGHTLGNSLRRIILSSLPGAAVTMVKIEGVPHEFSTIEGVKEDVIAILLNIKKLRFKMAVDEPQKAQIQISGVKDIKSGDIKLPGQVEIVDKEVHIASITDKKTSLNIELTIEKGLGYVPKEVIHRDKVDIGVIALDATFTSVRRVSYEVENMRVGDRTDYNRLRINIETDGVISPREALEKSIEIMINQLKAIVGFKEEVLEEKPVEEVVEKEDPTKKKVVDLDLSSRTVNALTKAGVKTVSGLVRKKETDVLAFEDMGAKGIKEIKKVLNSYGLALKE